MTLGHYLSSNKYSRTFTYNYVVPMCAAVWSVPNAKVAYMMHHDEGRAESLLWFRFNLRVR